MFTIQSVKMFASLLGSHIASHLTYTARQVTVDRPDDGCIAETFSLVLLTLIHIVVLDCVSLYQWLLCTTGWILLRGFNRENIGKPKKNYNFCIKFEFSIVTSAFRWHLKAKVTNCTPDDGRVWCPKHVEAIKLRILSRLVGSLPFTMSTMHGHMNITFEFSMSEHSLTYCSYTNWIGNVHLGTNRSRYADFCLISEELQNIYVP
jgi:hypothetical protein